MAHYLNYVFRFETKAKHVDTRIELWGPDDVVVKYRSLGGSPVLRRDKNDCICGTSLEFPAECVVDGEFEVLNDIGPYDWNAKLYSEDNLIWEGFVTPELISAPDIAPPYDVTITCSDALGMLKENDFDATPGRQTIKSLLEYMLYFTGLGSLEFTQVTDLQGSVLSPGLMIANTYVDLGHLVGETCYDVLQSLLASLHMNLTQHNHRWLLFKETGMALSSDAVSCYLGVTSTASTLPIYHYGSLASHRTGWWPVDKMSHVNVPARNRMILTSENHYIPDLFSVSSWQAVEGAIYTDGYWNLPAIGDGIKQSRSFAHPLSQRLILNIDARNVGAGQDAAVLAVKVKATGTSYAGSGTYYLADGTMGRRHQFNGYQWSTQETFCNVELQAPSSDDTDSDYVSVSIVLPFYRNNSRDYFYGNSVEVTVYNLTGAYEQRIYGVALTKYETCAGYRKTVYLGNGARGAGQDVDLIFAAISGSENNYEGAEELMYGVPCSNSGKITTWGTSLGDFNYLSMIARDYALSIAQSRTRKRGTLNIGTFRAGQGQRMPFMFRDDSENGLPLIVETFEWRIHDDEMEVELISLPADSIVVSDESVDAGDTNNATNHQQSPVSSGGGGGGGGSVTSVGLSMPSQFDVSGSPVTGAGVLTVTLNSQYEIPTAARMTILNQITNQLIQNWTTAYQQAHTHNNKSLLDTITQSRMNAWDAAGGGSVVAISDLLTGGTLVATITVDGTAYRVRIPAESIDISIGGTAAAPTIRIDLGSGAYDYVAIPIASTSQSGIVSTGDQSFGGGKTFERIYLGNSRARGAYIEWDDTRRAFKVVGSLYATGDLAAGE